MKEVKFKFVLDLKQVATDCNTYDIKLASLQELKCIAKGKVYLDIGSEKEIIIFDTEIVDYILQLLAVIKEIDSGNFNAFSVSSMDYYSNSYEYNYYPKSGELEIREANDDEFGVITNYNKFKKDVEKFNRKVRIELEKHYPELSKNNVWIGLTSALR